MLLEVKIEKCASRLQQGAMSSQIEIPNISGRNVVKHRARGYQLEMLEESLRGNVIVAVRGDLHPL